MCKRRQKISPAINKTEDMANHQIIKEDLKRKEGIINNNLKEIILIMIGRKMRETKGIKYRKIMGIQIIKEDMIIIGQKSKPKGIIKLSDNIRIKAKDILISKIVTIIKEKTIEIMEGIKKQRGIKKGKEWKKEIIITKERITIKRKTMRINIHEDSKISKRLIIRKWFNNNNKRRKKRGKNMF